VTAKTRAALGKDHFRLVLLILFVLCHGFRVAAHGSPSLLQYLKRLVVLDDLPVVTIDY